MVISRRVDWRCSRIGHPNWNPHLPGRVSAKQLGSASLKTSAGIAHKLDKLSVRCVCVNRHSISLGVLQHGDEPLGSTINYLLRGFPQYIFWTICYCLLDSQVHGVMYWMNSINISVIASLIIFRYMCKAPFAAGLFLFSSTVTYHAAVSLHWSQV